MGGNDHFVRRGSSLSSNLRAACGVWTRAAYEVNQPLISAWSPLRMSSLVRFPTAAASTKHPVGIVSASTACTMRREIRQCER